jgi:hypothetical protein
MGVLPATRQLNEDSIFGGCSAEIHVWRSLYKLLKYESFCLFLAILNCYMRLNACQYSKEYMWRLVYLLGLQPLCGELGGCLLLS